MSERLTIALPVLNEESVLRRSVESVIQAARGLTDTVTSVVIADNGSTDRTEQIGRQLAAEHSEVHYVRLAERGKGLAVFAAWDVAPADIYAFMDIDLSTDLAALPALVAAVRRSGGMAIGSRYHSGSRVERSWSRRLFSFGYRTLLHTALRTSVHDAPCGFKAISRAVFEFVVPKVEDRRWFFDTELIVRAERAGFPVVEIPVVWREQAQAGRKSRVNAPKLAWEYTRHVLDLRRKMNRFKKTQDERHKTQGLL